MSGYRGYQQRSEAEAEEAVEDFDASVVNLMNWHGQPIPPRQWVVNKLIPNDNVTMLSGDGGLGKTTLISQLGADTTVNRQWLGLPTARCRTIGVFCEDPEVELMRRLTGILAPYELGLGALSDRFDILCRDKLDSVLVDFDKRAQGVPTRFYRWLKERVDNSGAALLLLDSRHDVYAGNENDRVQVRHFVKHLRALAPAVVFADHPSRAGLASGSGDAGSTAWHNAVRSRLYLHKPEAPKNEDEKEPDPGARHLSTRKANYAATGSDIELRWQDGRFERYGGGLDTVSTIERNVSDQRKVEAFLAAVQRCHSQGVALSMHKSAGNYAPKRAAKMSVANGFTVRDMARAMDLAFDQGLIAIGDTGLRDNDRKQVRGIVLTNGVTA